MKGFKRLPFFCLVLIWLAGCAPPPQASMHDHNHDHGHTPATVAKGEPTAITINDLRKQMDQGTDIVFIDTRNEMAWETSGTQIPGSIRVSDNKQLAELIKELPKNSFIVPYCT